MKDPIIQDLLDKVEELYFHPRNVENLKKWVRQPKRALDNKWRHLPETVDFSRVPVPIVVNMEPSLRSEVFDYSVRDYFHNPQSYLEYYLKHEIFHFSEIVDDVPLLRHIPAYCTAYFEATLCGAEIVYLDDHDAILPDKPHMAELSEVELMPLADFNRGPSMTYAKKLYEYVLDQVQGREFTVAFPEWLRNPFGVATWLYGEDRLLEAIESDPRGVHRLIRYATDCRKEWTGQRRVFLGEEDYVTAPMYSDSVRDDTMGPDVYEEFVYPYELEVAELHGGIYYWHSCGDTSKLLESIGRLPIQVFHVGPWTSVQKAAEVFGSKGTALEFAIQKHGDYGPTLRPAQDDVFRASPEDVESKLRDILSHVVAGGVSACFVDAGPLHRASYRGGQTAVGDVASDVQAVQQWVRTARGVLERTDAMAG